MLFKGGNMYKIPNGNLKPKHADKKAHNRYKLRMIRNAQSILNKISICHIYTPCGENQSECDLTFQGTEPIKMTSSLTQAFNTVRTNWELNIWKNIKNIRGRYGAKLRKVWRYENYKNYLSQIKKENNFEQYHNGNLDALKDYICANYCTFNAKNGGYVSIFKRNHLCLPKVLEKFA